MAPRSARSAADVLVVALALTTIVTGAGAGALAAGDAPGHTVSGQPAAQTVAETDRLHFEPETVRVVRGNVVEWTDTGVIAHNVTFDQYPGLTSRTMNGGDRYEIRFTAAGTYQYRCTFHPGMVGTVTVSS
jgi:plastocyanin